MPLDGIQDFEIGAGALEVKATLARNGFPAKIGSLEQLDDSVRQPLFLAGVKLQPDVGKTLPEFVRTLRQSVNGDTEAVQLLAERLLAAGYYDAHAERYTRRFLLANINIIEVTTQFPRLTPSSVPAGIMWAMYGIDLEKTPGENIRVEEVLKQLGVI